MFLIPCLQSDILALIFCFLKICFVDTLKLPIRSFTLICSLKTYFSQTNLKIGMETFSSDLKILNWVGNERIY